MFKDEVYVNGKKVLDIPIANMSYIEKKFQFKSKWSNPVPKKKKLNNAPTKLISEGINRQDMVFDPLKALSHKKQHLAITDGSGKSLLNSKRRSGWGDKLEKTFQPPPLNVIARNLNIEEIEYLLRLYRLDDLNKKQREAVLEVADKEVRSPSPEPVYDNTGQRINTLEQRVKGDMIVEKNGLIEDCRRMDVGFMTPYDWKNLKRTKKVFIPEYDDPELNYVSILLGPGGRTQRILEELSGCRISIRGKQAGNGRKNLLTQAVQTHVLIQAENDEQLEKGVSMVEKILRGESIQDVAKTEKKFIRTGHELVAIETVLRKFCKNCKAEGHKVWECPYMAKTKLGKRDKYDSDFLIVKCDNCGDKRHLTMECPKRKKIKEEMDDEEMDHEFAKFLNDVNLGEAEIIDMDKVDKTGNALTNFITDEPDPSKGRKMLKDK